jgi:Ca2+/Na+ antiporter
MDKKPSYMELYFELLFSWQSVLFVAFAFIFIYFSYKMNKKFRKEKKIEIKTDYLVLYKILLYIGIMFLLAFPTASLFLAKSSQVNSLNENHRTSELNKEWFLQNNKFLYEDLEDKKYKVLKIKNIKLMKEKRMEIGINEDLKETLMYKSMEEFLGEPVYLMSALVENEDKKKEEIKMLVTLDNKNESNENSATLKDTNDNKEDMGKKVLYGTLAIDEEAKELFLE